MQNDNTCRANVHQSRCLTISSFFFCFPSIYAYYNNLYIYFILLVCTSMISALYWIYPIESWRRNLDLFFAKISFTIFVLSGIIYIKDTYYLLFGYSGLFILLYFYYLSYKLHLIKNNNWYKYHILFHFIMMCEQFIILDSIINK